MLAETNNSALSFSGLPTVEPETADAFLSGMPDPESVRKLESIAAQLPQINLLTQMLVHEGLCARTILIPKGAFLTGALTKKANICIMFGDITVTTDEGSKRLTGFNIIPAMPGFKRAGVAHSDTIWTTVHRTDFENIEDIENEMTDEAQNLQTRTLAISETKTALLEGDL